MKGWLIVKYEFEGHQNNSYEGFYSTKEEAIEESINILKDCVFSSSSFIEQQEKVKDALLKREIVVFDYFQIQLIEDGVGNDENAIEDSLGEFEDVIFSSKFSK